MTWLTVNCHNRSVQLAVKRKQRKQCMLITFVCSEYLRDNLGFRSASSLIMPTIHTLALLSPNTLLCFLSPNSWWAFMHQHYLGCCTFIVMFYAKWIDSELTHISAGPNYLVLLCYFKYKWEICKFSAATCTDTVQWGFSIRSELVMGCFWFSWLKQSVITVYLQPDTCFWMCAFCIL